MYSASPSQPPPFLSIRRSQNSGAPSMASSLCHLLLLLSLVFFNPISVLPVCALNSEGLALLSFKSSIQSDPQASLTNWNPAQPNPCPWNGITCNPSSSVISISLPKSNLIGSLPISLSSLPSLRHINLRTNRLSGPLPPSLFLPLSALQSLVLSGNSFSGSIPTSLTHCHKLRALDLSRNNLTGSLPADFATSLVSLQRLDLSHNRLDGSIPADVGNLSSLQDTADFSHNLFSGSIPASLGDLPEKVYIDLTYNNLSGPIPQIGALANRGPTAFIGNPGLCGPPLRNPCSSLNVTSTGPFLPSNNPPQVSEVGDGSGRGSSGKRGLSRTVVTAIVASDAIGIGLIALVFYCCYRRATALKGGEDSSGKSDKGATVRSECMCFRKDESETISENVEQYDLVALDRHLGFNLDELLRASAFVLGKSEIGIVYKVVLEDGITLAVRRLGEGGSQRFREFRTEVEAIGKVRHDNIEALRAYYWSTDEKLLIYDYIPSGSLSSAIHGKAGSVTFSPLSWDQRFKIMRGIAKGLAFLHEFSPKKYVHGDLKPSNILLGSNMEPYISDFGLGRLATIAGGSPLMQSYRTPRENPQNQQSDTPVSQIISSGSCYQAPEALKSLKPSQKWDVYSYGVILLELISGRSPALLLETSEMDLVHWVQYCIEEKKLLLDVLDPSLANDLDREDMFIAVLKIALTCVQSNPERRPLMRHIADALDRFFSKR